MVMAKGIIQTAADAVKTVAGAAIGAAAAAATTVVVESVANSIKGRKKEYQAPAVERRQTGYCFAASIKIRAQAESSSEK
jgi:Rieske Fe-S protein